jgi:MarR family transcriptional regulator for hemolysin
VKKAFGREVPPPPHSATPTFMIGEIARLVHAQIRREGDRLGIKLGFRHILYQLTHNRGCTQQELVRLTKLSAPTVSVTLSQMELLGLIHRRVDKKDMRLVHVELTDKGFAMSEDLKNIVKKIEETAVSGFTDEEIESLTGNLRRIRNNLEYEEYALEEAD